MSDATDHPINRVTWIPRERLRTNDYNPNSQVSQSHALLIESIRTDGWTQPIVVRPAGEDGKHVIIDGEHRWRASEHLECPDVPVVILEHDDPGCIASTVRHNRARGSHGVEHMAQIVKRLRVEGCGSEDIESMLGMTASERERLEISEDAFLAFMSGEDMMMKAH